MGQPALTRLAALTIAALILGLAARAYVARPALPLDFVLLDWAPVARAPVAIAYHLDGLSLFFAGLAALTTLTLLIAWNPAGATLESRSIALAIASLAALLGVVLAGDLVILYVSWEVLGLAAHLADRSAGSDVRPAPAAQPSRTPTEPKQASSGPAPYAVGHLSGYGLLAAALILVRANDGSFASGALSPEPWAGILPGLVLVAALGRLVHAWAEPGASRGPLRELTAALLTLSAAYLLLRGLTLAGGTWTPAWSVNLIVLGGLVAVAGSLGLSGVGLGCLLRRWIWIDAGLLIAALGIGGALGLGACLLQVLSLILSRLPAALCREPNGSGSQTSQEAAVAAGLAFGSLAALPPLLGFAARWLLIEAALERGLWLLLLAVTVASALAIRAGLESASRISAADTRRGGVLPRGPGPAGQGALDARPGVNGWPGPGVTVAVSLPILTLCLVPALLSQAVEPALATVASDWAIAVGQTMAARPTWPALLLTLLGPGLGVALHARHAVTHGAVAYRRRAARVPQARRANVKARGSLRALADARLSALSRTASTAAEWAVRLEEGPYAPATLVLAVAALVVLAT